MRFPSCLPALAAGLVFATSAFCADPREDFVQRTFPAKSGGFLVLDADRGSVTVEGGTGNQVQVEIERRVVRGKDAAAVALLKRHLIEFSDVNGQIRVRTQLKGKDSGSWRSPQLQVSFRVLVPRDFNVDVKTGGGGVRAANVNGNVTCRTSGGSVELNTIAGTVAGKTSGGSIKGTHLTGSIELSTSGGGIRVSHVSGGDLKVSTSGGSIHLDNIQAPSQARTSGGSIELESTVAPVQAITSGGSISLRLPTGTAFDLDAATSGGGVRSEFPVSATKAENRSSLRGPVNGGGPKVVLRTSGGGIQIRKF